MAGKPGKGDAVFPPIQVGGVEWRLTQVDHEPEGFISYDPRGFVNGLGKFARMFGANKLYLPPNPPSAVTQAFIEFLWDGQPTIFRLTQSM
jgi:hypothetical protein